jgi:hypothetical protein
MKPVNIATTGNFRLLCSKIPLISDTAVSVSLPTQSIGTTTIPWRSHDWNIPSTKETFDPITIEFIVDENYENYLEAYNWLQELRDYRSTKLEDIMVDASIELLNSSKNHIHSVKIEGLFPTILSEIQLFTLDQAEPQKCSLTCVYTQFTIV